MLCISRLLFFLFPLCASESTPTKSRKGAKPSPERAPDQVPKGPPTVRKHPDSDLNEAKLCPIGPSILLVFLNSQCRASFRPLPLQHAMPFWCQQNESTHHFLKSLTFRRPTLLFRDFDFVTVFRPPARRERLTPQLTGFMCSSALRGLWGWFPPAVTHGVHARQGPSGSLEGGFPHPYL